MIKRKCTTDVRKLKNCVKYPCESLLKCVYDWPPLLQLTEQSDDRQSREDADLAIAMAASLADSLSSATSSAGGAEPAVSGGSRSSQPALEVEEEEDELERALQLSLTDHLTTVPKPSVEGNCGY